MVGRSVYYTNVDMLARLSTIMQKTMTKGILTFILTLFLISIATAYVVPNVYLPNGNVDNAPSTSDSVSWYKPPVCYECVPAPTPQPTYTPIGLSISPLTITTKENRMVTLQATQTSGTPVLTSASWQWIIQNPRGYSSGVINGQVASFNVGANFGKWTVNLNVRDQVQMLNGHLSTKVNIIKK